MGYGNFMKKQVLDHTFGCGTRNYTPDTIIYVGVSRSAPLDDLSGLNEPSDTAYVRVPTDQTYWDPANAVDGTTQNAIQILFSDATDDWGTLSDTILMKSPTGTNVSDLIMWGPMIATKYIAAGEALRFKVSDIDVSLD